MENSKKAALVNLATKKINEALSMLDRVEDDQTYRDREVTKLYYNLYELQSELEMLADDYESN